MFFLLPREHRPSVGGSGAAPCREVDDPLALGVRLRDTPAACLRNRLDGGLRLGAELDENTAGEQRRTPAARKAMHADGAACRDLLTALRAR